MEPIVSPTPAPAPQAVAPAVVAPAAVPATFEPGHIPPGVQGAPHPGSFDPPASPEVVQQQQAAAASAAAANAAAVAATQLPANVSPESAAVTGSARSIAAGLGFEAATRFGTDAEFVQALLGQAQAAAAAQGQLQALQQAQAAAAQQAAALAARQQAPNPANPAQPVATKWWNPPEYNAAWAGMVRRNEQGIIEGLPGVPADIAHKVTAYEAYKRDFADRFLSNPESTLMPMVQQAAEERAREVIRKEMQERSDGQYINSFVESNSGWLHARDAQGTVITDPGTGRPILSPTGRAFQGHVNAAQQMGISDIRAQEQYAKAIMQRDYLQQQAATAQQQQQATAAVVGANRMPGVAGAMPVAGTNPPPTAGMSLSEQMALAFQAHGITDSAFNEGR